MSGEDSKTDDDAKRDYLIRTFSRTKRKDYENYVVNAVWNRLGMRDVKPVTQQPVLCPGKAYKFIDLYFPQVGIGVECDEAYHQNEEQHSRDIHREITIIEVLRQIHEGDYELKRIDATKPFAEFEQSIDDVVSCIADKVNEQKANGTFKPWIQAVDDWRQYYADKDRISVSDDIGFPRIVDAVNTLCSADYKGYQIGGCVPSALRPVYGDEYRTWFPKLAVNGKAIASGWNNRLSPDGLHIEEYNEYNPDAVDPVTSGQAAHDKRITFVKSTDPMTRQSSYRFVGVFQRITNNDEGTRKRYERIADSFPIIRA